MLGTVGLWAMLGVALADPGDEAAAPPPTAAAEASARAEVERAARLYAEGDPAQARALLQALLAAGTDLPSALRAEALAWLGDILYGEDGASAAAGVFRTLLDEAPTWRMDPYVHPPEVCAFFADLQRERERPVVTEPPPVVRPERIEPFSAAVFVPGGYLQFRRGRVVSGVTVATVQAASLGVSAWMYLQLSGAADVEQRSDEASARRDLQFANWTVAGVGWLAYLVPIAVEASRAGSAPPLRVAFGPAAVRVTGAF
jgi:hypothetical protein